MAKKPTKKQLAKRVSLSKAIKSVRTRELKEYLADNGLRLTHGYETTKRKRK
jgi:hypothetical protein